MAKWSLKNLKKLGETLKQIYRHWTFQWNKPKSSEFSPLNPFAEVRVLFETKTVHSFLYFLYDIFECVS